ncbi:MAG: Uma2 family endonuclease [Planctomycetes bacterium]|nr:Uma2 family endonuclease [Planctomycetota bacterium]
MSRPTTTACQLANLPGDDDRFELVAGELRPMTPGGPDHGFVALNIGGAFATHARRHRLGRAFGADTGFLLTTDPDTVLTPDAAFVRADRCRLPKTRGFFHGPPDLAVEVRSPNDSRAAMKRKARLWPEHGCPCVLTIDPEERSATVWTRPAPPVELDEHENLDLEAILPGLRVRIGDLFDDGLDQDPR